MDDFADIINLPHHVSKTRRQMPLADRAVQFSAFAALTGYDEEIGETARLTDVRAEMAEDDLAALDAAFQRLLDSEAAHPTVTLTCFQPDARKAGGRYVNYTGAFRHYNAAEHMLIFTDGTRIPVQSVCMLMLHDGTDGNTEKTAEQR